MVEQKMTDSLRAYLKNIPEIDSEIVLDAVSLLSLHHEVDLLSEILNGRLGFNARQIETLEALFHHPDKTLIPAQLAERAHLTRSAMTSNLDSLERKGYLARTPHPEDRRMIAITLTEKGKQYCEESLPVRYHDMAKIVGILTPDERHILSGAYTKIAEYLKQSIKEDSIGSVKTPAREVS